jgi:hypothetical protein
MERSVRIVGWSTIVLSVIVILTELIGLFLGESMDQIRPLLTMLPQARTGSIQSLMEMFQYTRAWSLYTIVYFAVVLLGAIRFVRFHAVGRIILEIAGWVGLLNACVDTALSYMIWKNMQAMMSAVVGLMGMRGGDLNPLGIATIIAGFFFWIVPASGMIVYLRKPKLRELMR